MRAVLAMFVLCVSSVSAQEATPTTPKEQFEALVKEYDAAQKASDKRFNPEAGPIDLEARYDEWPGWSFAPRFLKLAEANPKDPAAADALFWIVDRANGVPVSDKRLLPAFERALDLLLRDHLQDERVGHACQALTYNPSPPSERFLRAVLEKGRDKDARGRACLALAEYLTGKSEIARRPWFDDKAMSPWDAFLKARFDPGYFAYIREANPQASYDEAEGLLNRTITEFADIKDDRGRPLADLAKADWFQLRNLTIGRVAPDIEGEDVDGKPMKLSDYRGKVVVLLFWSDAAEREMYPHLRSLVKRWEGQPFVLLGVNVDRDREAIRKVIREQGITWRSWWDGGDKGSRISSKFVSFGSLPAYVIDPKGVIRYKVRYRQIGDTKKLDEAVDAVLKEL